MNENKYTKKEMMEMGTCAGISCGYCPYHIPDKSDGYDSIPNQHYLTCYDIHNGKYKKQLIIKEILSND